MSAVYSLGRRGSLVSLVRSIFGIDRVFDVDWTGHATLSDLTIQNGGNVTQGGGIRVTGGAAGGRLDLDNVKVENNTATIDGAGIFSDGVISLTDVEITGNTNSDRGGGLFMAILFSASVLLVGPAWCSWLCYIGAWDDRVARLRHHLVPGEKQDLPPVARGHAEAALLARPGRPHGDHGCVVAHRHDATDLFHGLSSTAACTAQSALALVSREFRLAGRLVVSQAGGQRLTRTFALQGATSRGARSCPMEGEGPPSRLPTG